MNLYEINHEIIQTINNNVDENGEITDEAIHHLEVLNLKLSSKMENIVKYIKNLESDETSLNEEIKRLSAKKQQKTKKINSLKKYLHNSMENAKLVKKDVGIATISFRNSQSVNIFDEEKVPDEFIKITEKKSFIKKDIKNFLKTQTKETSTFACIEYNKSLQIK